MSRDLPTCSGEVGVGLNVRRMMLDYLSSFTIAFSLRPVGDIGTVFRRYPGQWKVGCSEQFRFLVLGGLFSTSLPRASHKQCFALHREHKSANHSVSSGVQQGGNACFRCSLRMLRCLADLHWPLSGMIALRVRPHIVPRYPAVCPFPSLHLPKTHRS